MRPRTTIHEIDGISVKKCSKCKVEKPLTEFGKNKQNWHGLTAYCKPCLGYLPDRLPRTRVLSTPRGPRLGLRRTTEDGINTFNAFRCCWVCGATLSYQTFKLAHITPLSRGGNDFKSNLMTLCAPCCSHRGMQTLSELRAAYLALSPDFTPPAMWSVTSEVPV